MARFAEAVIEESRIKFFPAGRATWMRPEITRAIEADECYMFEPAKIATANAAIKRKSKSSADYPNPDLAIEIDISRLKVDRPGIYAAMKVSELWRFDKDSLVIERLGPRRLLCPG